MKARGHSAGARPAEARVRAWAAARRFLPIGLVLLLLAAGLASGAWPELSFADLAAHHVQLQAYVAGHALASLALYAALFTLLVISCLPGMSVLLVAGGYLFGAAVGGAVGLAAATLGSAVVFLASRTAFGEAPARRPGARLGRLEQALREQGFSFLLSLRLFPAAPYCLATLAAAAARARLRDLLAATAIGSAPVAFLLAGLGAGLGRAFADGVQLDRGLLAHPRVFLPLAGLALLSAAPWAWRLARRRRSAPRPSPDGV